ncbi:hypothetical protein A9Z06_27330 [Rhizobium sp. YK2]|nr:hypothetical protein A9Z06_27330 [Rhizobium sp. YK2]
MNVYPIDLRDGLEHGSKASLALPPIVLATQYFAGFSIVQACIHWLKSLAISRSAAILVTSIIVALDKTSSIAPR